MEKRVRGTRDYYGNDSKKINILFSILDKISKEFSYNKIITPTFENSELFHRTVGSETDAINKEMYTFEDKGGRMLSLRPEGTASAVRLALENNLLDNNVSPSLYYISNMFRYERPQKGRQREFFQFGVENFGKDHVFVELEIIQFAETILNRLQISKYELKINSIGDSSIREKYSEALKGFVLKIKNKLSNGAIEKLESNNLMRIFDSKIDKDIELLKEAPSINDFLSERSNQRFDEIKLLLKENDIKFTIDDKLVRGLDYYNDFVFEFVSTDVDNLGTKSTIIGGGRYDSLVNKMDNKKDVPAIGFALGIERVLLASDELLTKSIKEEKDYYVAVGYDEPKMNKTANALAISLREKGFEVMVDYSDRKLKKKIERAEKIAKFVIIVGNEIADGKVSIKEFITNKTITKDIKEI